MQSNKKYSIIQDSNVSNTLYNVTYHINFPQNDKPTNIDIYR